MPTVFDGKKLRSMLPRGATIEERMFADNAGHSTYVRAVHPKRRSSWAAIVLPGLGATVEISGKNAFASGFARLGMGSIMFDFFGHGRSSGNFFDITISMVIEQLGETIEYASKTWGYKKFVLLGSSTPCLAQIVSAVKKPAFVKALVLINPILDMKKYVRRTRGEEGAERWQRAGYIYHPGNMGTRRLGYGYYKDFVSYSNYRTKLARLQCSTLWFAASNDEYIDPAESEKNSTFVKRVKFESIPRSNHLLERPDGTKYDPSPRVFAFVKKQLRTA